MFSCDSARVCDPSGTCVAPQCQTSGDCVTPDKPVCIGQVCVEACVTNDDCTGSVAGSFCATTGACVECIENSQCTTAESPACDGTTHACRGCENDTECPNGVCLEADGQCAPDSRVAYVRTFGTDSGNCEKAAPCETLQYALTKLDATRNIVHIDGASLELGGSTLTINRTVYIDGTDTSLVANAVPPLAVGNLVTGVTLAKVTVSSMTVGMSSSARVFASDFMGITVTGGTLNARKSKLGGINCTSGTASALESTIGGVMSSNCQLVAKRSVFGAGGSRVMGGLATIENNVLVANDCIFDMLYVAGVASGSTVRFNTFVCTSTVSSDGLALECDGTPQVTSNIFAYNSMHPMGPPGGAACPAQYSLFDTVTVAAHTAGTGNVVADGATFFLDRPTKDFHLSATSPARSAAQTGLDVNEDFEGNMRPNPAGSTPDMGAYEAP